jgi:hypothetical protein
MLTAILKLKLDHSSCKIADCATKLPVYSIYKMNHVLPKKQASPVPELFDKQIRGNIEKKHGYWVVEKSENVDRMYSVRCTAHEEKDKGWNLK